MANRGVNKVILIGNLGFDPEVRYLPNGGMVAAIRLATSESWKDQAGQPQERTEWHRVVFFRRLAEIAGEYLRKGGRVYIEGSLRTQQWEKNGEKRFTTEIVANELQMLDRVGGTGDGQSPVATNGKVQQQPHRQPTPNPSQPVQQNVQPAPTTAGGGVYAGAFEGDEFEDDIPFVSSRCRQFRRSALKTGLVSFTDRPIF